MMKMSISRVEALALRYRHHETDANWLAFRNAFLALTESRAAAAIESSKFPNIKWCAEEASRADELERGILEQGHLGGNACCASDGI